MKRTDPRWDSEAEYAAALAKFAPKEGGPCRYDEAAVAEHDADVQRVVYGPLGLNVLDDRRSRVPA